MATVSQKSTGTQRNYHSFEKTSRKARVGGCFSRAFVAELPETGRGIRYFCRISPSGGRQKQPLCRQRVREYRLFSRRNRPHDFGRESAEAAEAGSSTARRGGQPGEGTRRGRGDERRGGEIAPGQRRTFRRSAGDPGPIAAMPCFQASNRIGAKGFEPSTSWSQTRRSNQAELRPVTRPLRPAGKSTRNRPKTSLGPVSWLFPPRHPPFRTASGSWASTPWRWRRRASR